MTANSQQQLKLERPIIVFLYQLMSRWLGGYKFLLLTTIGRKSQRSRTVPLVYMPVDGGFMVVAANIGLDTHPGWFLNLQHNPQAHIQIGSKQLNVTAAEVPLDERDKLWSRWIQANPGYQGFQAKTARKLPIVILIPSSS